MATLTPAQITTKLKNSQKSALSPNKRTGAEQLVFTTNEGLADYIEYAADETFIVKKNLKDVQTSVKDISHVLNAIKRTLATTNKGSPVDGTPDIVPPTPTVDQEALNETVRNSINRVVPPSIRDIEDKRSSFLTDFLKKFKKEKTVEDENVKKSILWNKESAKTAFQDKGYGKDRNSFGGRIANSVIAGIGNSPLFKPTSFLGNFLKALISPPGIILMYFIGKMFKTKILDKYLTPIMTWFNGNVKPMLVTTWGYIKDFGNWLNTLTASWTEIKGTFDNFKKVWNDPASTIWNKLSGALTITDAVLSPITNLIKIALSKMFYGLAKISDIMPFNLGKEQAVDLLKKSSEMLETMYGKDKDNSAFNIEMKSLKESDMGKKYGAILNDELGKALAEKIKKGEKLSPDEKSIANSDMFKNTIYGQDAINNKEKASLDYEAYLKNTITREKELAFREHRVFNEQTAINNARKSFNTQGVNNSKQLLNEISKITFNSSDEAVKFMKDIPVNYENLMKSSEGQKEVLKAIATAIKEQGKENAQTRAILGKMAGKSLNDQYNINIMQEGIEQKSREERSPAANYGFGGSSSLNR